MVDSARRWLCVASNNEKELKQNCSVVIVRCSSLGTRKPKDIFEKKYACGSMTQIKNMRFEVMNNLVGFSVKGLVHKKAHETYVLQI